VEVRAEPGHHRRGWRGDRGGRAEHGGGGGVAVLDLVEKEAKRHVVRMVLAGESWHRRMVLGGGAVDMVRMVVALIKCQFHVPTC
jgi:hypothetical protein